MGLIKISPKFYSWSEMHGRPDGHYFWNSYLLAISPENVVIVDPLSASEEVIKDIEEIGIPTDILLTCNWHLRDTDKHRKRWNCYVSLNEKGIDEAEIKVSNTFNECDVLWNKVSFISLSDISWPEEVAVIYEKKLLILDALVGGRDDIGVKDGEIGIHPNRFNMGHIKDLELANKLVLQLSQLPINSIYFGHGTPVIENPKKALVALSNELEYWQDRAQTLALE